MRKQELNKTMLNYMTSLGFRATISNHYLEYTLPGQGVCGMICLHQVNTFEDFQKRLKEHAQLANIKINTLMQ